MNSFLEQYDLKLTQTTSNKNQTTTASTANNNRSVSSYNTY